MIERFNARRLKPSDLPAPVDLVCIDVSFISLRLILPVVPPLLAPGADVIALVKPQFEVGRDFVGKGGIVTDLAASERAMGEVVAFVEGAGFALRCKVTSPIAGGDGNVETVLVFGRG